MYLSRLELQLSSPAVRQTLRNCQDMHRTLMKAFDCPREDAGLLYRRVETERSLLIYVQSMACPQWDRIEGSGFICTKLQDISALPETFREGETLRFSILACPSKKVKEDGKNSRRVLLRDSGERLAWVQRQGEKNGFLVLEAHETAKEQRFAGRKPSGAFFLSGVPFEGVLRITDAPTFRRGFQQGIGAEKAYGFGMLMIGRA